MVWVILSQLILLIHVGLVGPGLIQNGADTLFSREVGILDPLVVMFVSHLTVSIEIAFICRYRQVGRDLIEHVVRGDLIYHVRHPSMIHLNICVIE